MTSLNTSSIALTYGTVADLLSGASLSGLTGAVSPSPKVHVTGVSANIPGGSYSHTLTLYKGASGGSDPSTQVCQSGPSGQFSAALNIVLEAGEVLTALITTNSGSTSGFPVLISADIGF